MHFQTINHEESEILPIFDEMDHIYAKSLAFKINQPQENFIIRQLISNFTDFRQKNNVFPQNDRGYKNIRRKKKVYN